MALTVTPATSQPRSTALSMTSKGQAQSTTAHLKSTCSACRQREPTLLDEDVEDEDESIDFEVMIWGVKPVRQAMNVRGKSRKVPQPSPSTYGPVMATTGDGWEGILNRLAACLHTDESFLALHSMEWRWLWPANSAWLPLRDPNGFLSLLKQLKTSQPRGVTNTYIIIRMDEPARQPVAPSVVSIIT